MERLGNIYAVLFLPKKKKNERDRMRHRLSGSLPDLKVQSDRVNGCPRATGVVLEGPCEESLGEEEAANPEDGWNAATDPSLQKIDPLKQVRHPGGQWLQRRICLEGDGHSKSYVWRNAFQCLSA